MVGPPTEDDARRSTPELQPGPSTQPSAKALVRQLVRGRLFGGSTSHIGRYKLLGHLGSGGMGTVFRAKDDALGRFVAIKVVRAHGRTRDAALLREARAMAALSHPNIVEVFEVGTADCGLFIAMEVVDGLPVSTWLRRSSNPERLLQVMAQAGQALAHAHAHDVAHGDFKPAHVIVDDACRVTVLDFGLAHRVTDDLRSEDAGAGTPAFMAPERLGGGPPTPAADQFAFCATLFELLFGYHPFGDGRTRTVRVAIRNGSLRAPPRWRVAPRVRRAILRGLEGDPAKRFGSMDALLVALQPRSRALQPIVFASVAVAIGLGVTLGSARADPRAACVDRASEVTERWTSARPEIEAALDRTGSSLARDTWTRVDRLGSDYAGALSNASEASCTPETDADTRWLCLAKLRSGFDEACSLLSGADDATVAKAVDILQGLEPISSCDSTRSHADMPASNRAELHEVRAKLAEAAVLQTAGRDRDALEVARDASDEAQRLGDGQTIAEADMRIGATLSALGDEEEAVQHFERAFFYAEAHDDSVAAIDAATQLAATLGSALHRRDEAERWAERAEARLLRSGLTGTLEHAELLRTYGEIRRAQGKLDAALEYYRAAEEILLQHPEHLRIGVLYGIGTTLARSGSHREGLDVLVESHRIATEHYGKSHPTTTRPQIAIGLALSMMDDQEGARAELEDALRALEAVHGKAHPSLRDVLGKLSIVASRTGQRKDAIRYQERAIEIERAGANPAAVAELQVNLVSFYSSDEQPERAIAVGLEAATTLEDVLGPRDRAVASAFEAVGMVYARTGDFALATEYVDRALAIYEDALGADHPVVGYALGARALLAHQQDRTDEALEFVLRAHAIFVGKLGPSHIRTRHSYADVVMLLEAKGRYAESSKLRTEALAGLRQRSEVTNAELGAAEVGLALALLESGNTQAAEGHGAKALTLLDDTDADPGDRAKAQYVMARALWDSRRAEARALARHATRYYRSPSLAGDAKGATKFLQQLRALTKSP